MRIATVKRDTKETQIKLRVNLDGIGQYQVDTPIKFLDHMIEAFSKHSLIDVELDVTGDIEVDQHHTIEDLGIVMGKALKKALGNKEGINRAGFFIYPMDESLATVSLDIGGRPYSHFEADFKRRFCGDLDTDLIDHFFEALANTLGANVIIKLNQGGNDHHKLEAIFKSFAKSMKAAVEIDPRREGQVPSTKGSIET